MSKRLKINVYVNIGINNIYWCIYTSLINNYTSYTFIQYRYIAYTYTYFVESILSHSTIT